MVKAAIQAEEQDQKIQEIVASIQNQILVTTFTEMSIEHLQSGEPLTLASGREIANAAEVAASLVIKGYVGFLYEKLGFAMVDKVLDVE